MNVMIAGASRGIGLGLVTALLAQGHSVVAVARDPAGSEGLQALAKTHGDALTLIACDLNEPDAASVLRAGFGSLRFDRIVMNAGVKVPAHQSAAATTPDETALLFMTNAVAPIRVAQQLSSSVVDGGVIGFMSSQMASLTLNRAGSMPLYGASKAALNSLILSWASTLEVLPFSLLALHPGWVQTEMGGPDATETVDASAAGLIRTLDAYAGKKVCAFLDYQGDPMPW